MHADPHPRQVERLAALNSLAILDTPREGRFDRIVAFAAEICEAPIAVINLIDEHRQWFKAEIGLGVRETPLGTSLCSHAILEDGLTIINDTLNDPRTRDNPLCFDQPDLRFYAGALLQTSDGLPIGTLCVLDTRPRDLTDFQKRALGVLAEQVMVQMEFRRELNNAEELRKEIDHRVKNSLGVVGAMLSLQARQSDDANVSSALEFARNRVVAVARVHDLLQLSNSGARIDISQFCAQLAESLSGQATGGITITSRVPENTIDARVAINAGIVLNEIVTNAIRHAFTTGETGQVTIDGEVSHGRLQLSVRDTGSGLPEDFDPAESSGLGMRLSLSLSKQFGGTLDWRSDASGTMFSFAIPLTAEGEGASPPQSARA